MAERRAPDGRGQLSAIERLPDWADEARAWAYAQLKERKLTQVDILDGFNSRLRAAAWAEGLTDPPQVSPAALNRTSMRLAQVGRRLAETKAIADALAPRLDEVGDDSVTLLVAESIKSLVHEMLSNAGELAADGDSAGMLMMAARALKTAEEARKISVDQRKKWKKELDEAVGKSIEKVGAEAGLSVERIAEIQRGVLGLRQ
jgi:hypothetical protein